MSLKNKNIVITGATSGIGLELFRILYSHGNKILAVDKDEKGLRNLAAVFTEADYLSADLSSEEGLEQLLTFMENRRFPIDLFFANAGYARYGHWADLGEEERQRLWFIHVENPIRTARWLKERQGNHPFQLLITASAMAFWPVPGYGYYAACKAAIHRFAENLWAEKEGDWLSLAYPAATASQFFRTAGKNIPLPFPLQSPVQVAKQLLKGAEKKQKRIFPSKVFWWAYQLNRFFPIIQSIYTSKERQKLDRWKSMEKR